MPKKKIETKQSTNHFVYCNNRKCPFHNCLRRYEYAPRNILIYRNEYQLNKKGTCDYYLEEE